MSISHTVLMGDPNAYVAPRAQRQRDYQRAGHVWSLTTNSVIMAWQACRPLECGRCGHTIPPGTLFIRRPLPGQAARANYKSVNNCWDCMPWQFIENVPGKRRK